MTPRVDAHQHDYSGLHATWMRSIVHTEPPYLT